MSSLITVIGNEGESILPEVEELSEFHPDQLSDFVDIQEELEKLEASENVTIDEIMSIPTVDDVNVVDHEVTIVAEQANEEGAILPDITDIGDQSKDLSDFSIIEENLDIGETITIATPSLHEQKAADHAQKTNTSDQEKVKTAPIKPAATPVVEQAAATLPQLKAIRPLPDTLKGKKSFITVAQPKKNVLTKVIFTPNNHAAPDAPVIFGEAGGQAIRLVGQNKTIVTSSPKTITLAQAREMGLLTSGKVHHLLPNQSKNMVKKGMVVSANKTVTMVKSSPTKILPLPTSGQLHPIAPSPTINTLTSAPHKILIRQSPTVKSGTFSGTILASSSTSTQGQILQIPTSQENINNQIHQIHIPGKQVQYVRLVNPATTETMETVSKSEPVLITSVSTPMSRPIPVALTTSLSNASQLKVVPIAPAQPSASQNNNSFERVLVSPGLSQLTATGPDSKPPTSNIVMVPAEYVKQYKPLPVTNQSPPSPPKPTNNVPPPPPLLNKSKEVVSNKEIQSTPKSKISSEGPNGIRPRKPCNCTKSQCLKLYCDCFANGEFCFQCNCNSCFNNLDHEEERQRAIKACLERNPNAFRPKIGKGYVGDERRHNKGCNCKRSGCLKNYCECYEAKIPCSNNCKCIGCRNVEESKDARERNNSEGSKINQQIAVKSKLKSEIEECVYKSQNFLTSQGTRQPFNLMTQEVVEATCQCLLAQGDGQLTEQVERIILEEFGRCLVEIIDCATRTSVNNVT
uniref:CRC domain-containing protein n=1 Tax=Homalodisca liturata TaxID=320908 RepID=A0A1B6JGB0_9HEMI